MPLPSDQKPVHCPKSDLMLWDLLKNGERTGLEKLYLKYFVALFNFGMSLHGDRDLIKDCIQEVFVDLWKYRKSLGKTNNVKFYMLKSLSHKIYGELNREKRGPFDYNRDVYKSLEIIEPYEKELIQLQSEEKLRVNLRKAIENLPLRQKELIRLLFFENCSYEDISKIMGIGMRPVYNMAWRAISNLKKSIVSFILGWWILHL